MCLAVPMKIVGIEGNTASAEFGGAVSTADLSLVENLKVGDYVIVHAGFAIEKLDAKEAEEQVALFKKLAETRNSAAV